MPKFIDSEMPAHIGQFDPSNVPPETFHPLAPIVRLEVVNGGVTDIGQTITARKAAEGPAPLVALTDADYRRVSNVEVYETLVHRLFGMEFAPSEGTLPSVPLLLFLKTPGFMHTDNLRPDDIRYF